MLDKLTYDQMAPLVGTTFRLNNGDHTHDLVLVRAGKVIFELSSEDLVCTRKAH